MQASTGPATYQYIIYFVEHAPSSSCAWHVVLTFVQLCMLPNSCNLQACSLMLPKCKPKLEPLFVWHGGRCTGITVSVRCLLSIRGGATALFTLSSTSMLSSGPWIFVDSGMLPFLCTPCKSTAPQMEHSRQCLSTSGSVCSCLYNSSAITAGQQARSREAVTAVALEDYL